MTAHGECKRKVDDDEESTPPPPDGGWGWMVVFGSFMIHIISKSKLFFFIITVNVTNGVEMRILI